MNSEIVYDYSLKEKFLDFSDIAKIYANLSEEVKDNMIFLEEICGNHETIRNYFKFVERIIQPLTSRSEKFYFIDASTSFYGGSSESNKAEIYKLLDINLPTSERKNSKVFFSWESNPKGIEKILCGLDFGEDVHYNYFIDNEGEGLYPNNLNFIPKESEVNDWILEQILLDKKRKNVSEIFPNIFR